MDLQLKIVPNDDGVLKVQLSSPGGDADAGAGDDLFVIEQESPNAGSDVFLSPKEEPLHGFNGDDSPTAQDPATTALEEPEAAPEAPEAPLVADPRDTLQEERGRQKSRQDTPTDEQEPAAGPLQDEPLHAEALPAPCQEEEEQLQDEPLHERQQAQHAALASEAPSAPAAPMQPPPSPFFPVHPSGTPPGSSTPQAGPSSHGGATARGIPTSQNGTTAADLSPPSSPHPMDSIKPPSILQVDASYQHLLFSDGYDSHGRPVIVLNTSALPPKSRKDEVLTYLREQLSPVVNQGPYVLVLLACSGGPKYKSLPSMWTVAAYRSLARPFHKNVRFVIMVNPSLLVRFVLAVIKPFAKKKGYHKLKKVKELEEIDLLTNGEVRREHLGESFLSFVQRQQQNGVHPEQAPPPYDLS